MRRACILIIFNITHYIILSIIYIKVATIYVIIYPDAKSDFMTKKNTITNTKLLSFHRVDWLVPIFALLAFINPLRAAFSQYYILSYQDDIMWVSWASQNIGSPFALLAHGPGNGYRPTMNLLYALGYSLWGANEVGYYLLNGLLFVGAIVFLYLLVKMIANRLAASITVLFYLFLDSSFILVWKFNYIASVSELFFITSALYFSLHYFKTNDARSAYVAVPLSILAFFAKEPSILIIPTVNILYLLLKGRTLAINAKLKKVSIFLNILIPAISLYIIISMGEFTSSSSSSMLDLIKSRLIFYFEQELSWQLRNPYLVALVCIGSLYFYNFKNRMFNGISLNIVRDVLCIFLLLVAFLTFTIANVYSFAGVMLILLLLLIGFSFGDTNQRIGVAVFVVALVPMLVTSLPVQPTYLAEPNIGMCLFIGVTLSKFIGEFQKQTVSKSHVNRKTKNNSVSTDKNIRRNTRFFFSVVLIFVILIQFSVLPAHIQATNSYQKSASNSGTSFKESVNYLLSTVPESGTVYYIPDEKRNDVGRQINAQDLYDLLCLKGRCDINIESLDAFDLGSHSKNNPQYIILLGNLDAYVFSTKYPELSKEELYSSIQTFQNGDSVAFVLTYE